MEILWFFSWSHQCPFIPDHFYRILKHVANIWEDLWFRSLAPHHYVFVGLALDVIDVYIFFVHLDPFLQEILVLVVNDAHVSSNHVMCG